MESLLLSPLPFVNLSDIKLPSDGFFLPLSRTCQQLYRKDDTCKNHYLNLLQKKSQAELCACPHGFSSRICYYRDDTYALTGFIPFPRAGTPKERSVAKKEKKYKLSEDAVNKVVTQISEVQKYLNKLEDNALRNYSNALHEIRKLNGTIKQTAEKICLEESPDNLDNANPNIVTIYKSSEIMSKQFDIIEILANEKLIELPLNSSVEIYKIFDMCVRILKQKRKNIVITGPFQGYRPLVRVCDKTISIIPTVLLTNAIKYSITDSQINVCFEDSNNTCKVSISNMCKEVNDLPNSIYTKGKRIAKDNDGSGYGLYIAQRVAEQHQTMISHTGIIGKNGVPGVRFEIKFKKIDE